MNGPLKVRAVVTDIEGTTSALSFVKEVLFPYAQKHLNDYVQHHQTDAELLAILTEVRILENNPSLSIEAITALFERWMIEDKKIKPLKTLQGMIWQQGYLTGALTAHIYDDAKLKLQQWHASGIPLYIYSSGSVQAQKLLFAHTPAGDLTPLFSGYFDTAIGGKLDALSYEKVAKDIETPPGEILFLSDNPGEIDAATEAGFLTILLDRAGAVSQNAPYTRLTDFSKISLEKMQ